MIKYRYVVTEKDEGLDINQMIRRHFDFSRRFRTKIKFQKLIELDGAPAPGFIKPKSGSVIGIHLPAESSNFPAEDIPINVLYEDDDLLIIDKQPGITVHPTKGHPLHTLANGIMNYMHNEGLEFKIRFANRLDMDTSGIVIVAKNSCTQDSISNQMRSNAVVKKYKALVSGSIKKDMFTIDLPIGRSTPDKVERTVMEIGGKNAITDVEVLERYKRNTLVLLTIHTGRTHQIRVHMSHIGHPIVGDHLYTGPDTDLMPRQALHSCYISFTHPSTGETLTVKSELPEDMRKCISELKSI